MMGKARAGKDGESRWVKRERAKMKKADGKVRREREGKKEGSSHYGGRLACKSLSCVQACGKTESDKARGRG